MKRGETGGGKKNVEVVRHSDNALFTLIQEIGWEGLPPEEREKILHGGHSLDLVSSRGGTLEEKSAC